MPQKDFEGQDDLLNENDKIGYKTKTKQKNDNKNIYNPNSHKT